MNFTENSRVKIPAILHLRRLGYAYLPLEQAARDERANIFTDIFAESLRRLNPGIADDDVARTLETILLELDNEDLGEAFFKRLTAAAGVTLIDFDDFQNNALHVVTELPCRNGDEEFRPDITLLVNGMPLAFIEVKKPNNRDGVLDERNRMNARFKNKKFRRFINLFQLLVFSNNMEYDAESIEPIQGAFYATTARDAAQFHYFREEEPLDLTTLLAPEDEEIENLVLQDNNLAAIKHSPEFITNKKPETPTHRLLTALFSPARFAMLLKYGIAYVEGKQGREKHVMRYPQFFATKAIERTLDKGVNKGIIWHTQGSGKTALAFFNVRYLTDYFQRKGVVPKFYFIVDRLDLMKQAKDEFEKRGLRVNLINSREAFVSHFKTKQAIHNAAGSAEITVVNIQKFEKETDLLKRGDYDLNTQRVYFLDEAHRSYNPTGSFLANLYNSDRNAVLIALTGTPLIGSERRSRDVFGDYIHKYYYDRSIADGYTLKLVREGIETKYKMQLDQALKDVEILQGSVEKENIYAHPRFVEPMLDYIVKDFTQARNWFNDHSIGGMVVCDSAEQARKLFEIFVNKYNPAQKTIEPVQPYFMIAEASAEYRAYQAKLKQPLTAALILHDAGDKEERGNAVNEFKDGKIDLLFVYQMLLTGFDAPRLKKLYLGRIIKDHNLLQTLTRVNRPYKQFRNGFVVDFADIRKEFDATNKAYFDELQAQLGDEMQNYANLFKSPEEIEADIAEIREALFHYDLENKEIFSQQISAIRDRAVVLQVKKALENARNLYNLIRLSGHFDLLERLDFHALHLLLNETANHLALLNLKESVQNSADTTNLLNAALENVLFLFRKVSQAEMVIADRLKEALRKARETLSANFDPKDPAFVTLYDELKRLFEQKNLDEISQEEMKDNIAALHALYDKAAELNRKNALLSAKYAHDAKYARTHKRLLEQGMISPKESDIWAVLSEIKRQTDAKLLLNASYLENDAYFERMLAQFVNESFRAAKIAPNRTAAQCVKSCLVKEYRNEYQGFGN
ncbi:hypothetical protein U14_02085 [Candidatus Moduliflexus flocculans]|uniref:Type I restriction enzyme endonuclease subunit n=1 Tax=Candidatus Moduliflexus flocculans TaxID=1499966 RepID=A0A0S6VY14_9BACT|nr:hypothetical protein U14_02085 [Candidatus Moduliflexus flocculans]